MGLSLFAHSGMLLSYWPYAFQTATYLINRLPTLMLHHQSPYFALYHKLLAYTHLKVFGSFFFFHICSLIIPINSNTSHWSVFFLVTIHTKGYLCLDIHSGRVYISHHVIFNEDSFLFKNFSFSFSQSISSSSSLPFLCWFSCLSSPHLLLLLPLVLVPLSLPIPHFPLFHTLCLHLFHIFLSFLLVWTCLYLVWIQIYFILLALTIFILWWPVLRLVSISLNYYWVSS